MTVTELGEMLKTFPPTAEVYFLCPDGYEDTVDAVEMDGGNVELLGYMAYARDQRKLAKANNEGGSGRSPLYMSECDGSRAGRSEGSDEVV